MCIFRIIWKVIHLCCWWNSDALQLLVHFIICCQNQRFCMNDFVSSPLNVLLLIVICDLVDMSRTYSCSGEVCSKWTMYFSLYLSTLYYSFMYIRLKLCDEIIAKKIDWYQGIQKANTSKRDWFRFLIKCNVGILGYTKILVCILGILGIFFLKYENMRS